MKSTRILTEEEVSKFNLLYTSIKVSPHPSGGFFLLEEFVYDDVKVPKYYTMNGADIPRMFWSIYPPYNPFYFPAIVVHDWLCYKEEYDKADEYLKRMLVELEAKLITVNLFYHSTRTYHKIKY